MRRLIVRALLVVGLLLAVAAGWLAWALHDRPSLAPYAALALPPRAGDDGGLRLTFLGVATVLIDDGETAILTDGFFSRPELLRTLVGTIAPDVGRIESALRRAGIDRLAAVIPVHSHYDHAMDAPEVARRTGALLVGSTSTANVGRGWGLAEDRIRTVRGGETLRFGALAVRIIPARHFPHGMAMGEIAAPLRPPVRALAYREGGSFSVHVTSAGRTLLVHGSAGYREGGLAAHAAEVVLLGIGGLGTRDDAYRDAYWREVVAATGARRVVPIHWDDFTRPLETPLPPMPRLLDDVEGSIDFLLARGRAEGVDVRLAPVWRTVDPFAELGS